MQSFRNLILIAQQQGREQQEQQLRREFRDFLAQNHVAADVIDELLHPESNALQGRG